MPLSKTLNFLNSINKNKNEAINNNTTVKLNTSNTIAKEITSLPESLAILIGQKYIDNKTKKNFLFSQQNTEGKPLPELGINLATGGLTEKILREPLHVLIKDSLEKALNKNLSKGIAFGSSTTAESSLWSIPQSLQQNQNGDIGINKEALIQGTLSNEGMALGLGALGSLGNKNKSTEQITNNNEHLLEQQEPTMGQQYNTNTIDQSMQNMIDFGSNIPQYKPFKESKYSDEELMNALNNNDIKTLSDFANEQFNIKPNIKITNSKEEGYGKYDPLTNKLTLNKNAINNIDNLKQTLSHELTHDNLNKNVGSRYGSNISEQIDEYYAYLDNIANEKNQDNKFNIAETYAHNYTPDLIDLLVNAKEKKPLSQLIQDVKQPKERTKLEFEYSLLKDMYDLSNGKKDINEILKQSVIDKNVLQKFKENGSSVRDLKTVLKDKGFSLNRDKELDNHIKNMVDFGEPSYYEPIPKEELKYLSDGIKDMNPKIVKHILTKYYNIGSNAKIKFDKVKETVFDKKNKTLTISTDTDPVDLINEIEKYTTKRDDIYPKTNIDDIDTLHSKANEILNKVFLSNKTNIKDDIKNIIDNNEYLTDTEKKVKYIDKNELNNITKDEKVLKLSKKYNDLSVDDISNAIETLKDFYNNPEKLKDIDNADKFLNSIDNIRTYRIFSEPEKTLFKKRLKTKYKKSLQESNKPEHIKSIDSFRNSILENVLSSDKVIYDDSTKSEAKQLKSDITAENITIPRNIKTILKSKIDNYLKDKFNLFKDIYEKDKEFRKSLYNKGLKTKEDILNTFKEIRDEIHREINVKPTEYFKFSIEPKGKKFIVKDESILSNNINEKLKTIMKLSEYEDEMLLKKLEFKENYIAKKLEKENEPINKFERVKEQKENLEKYLENRSTQKQKIKKVELNKKENEVTKYMKQLVEYFQKENPKFKNERIEKLYSQYKNDTEGLKEKLNKDYKVITEVNKKYPEIFFNKDGSLDKEFFTRFLTRNKHITSKDIISKYEELLKKQKQTNKVKTNKQEPIEQQVGSKEEKQKEQTNKKETEEPIENKGDKKNEEPTTDKENETKKEKNKFRNNEYWNMVYSTKKVKLTSNNIKDLFNSPIKNKVKIFESMDFYKIKDAYRKLGVALTDKKEAYASGGSKPVHLVALVHEFIHNLNPKLSEKKVIGLTANTILKLLNHTKGLKEKFEITDDFIKELENQANIYKNDKSVESIIRYISGNKELKDIIVGNQSLWYKWIKADQMVSDLLTKKMENIIGSKKIKHFKETFDKKAPTILKHILFEANLLEPEKAVKELIELKKRINISKDEFVKALEYEIKDLKKHFNDVELNTIITSGIIQLKTLLDEQNIIDKVKSFDINKLNKQQLRIIRNNLDFRISGINDSFRIKNKVDYLGNSTIKKTIDKNFGSYENYALARTAYILKNIPKEKLDNFKDVIRMYNSIQSKVVNKDFLILGYKPYVIKTLSTLKLAIDDYERKSLIKQGYKEIEPYIFEVPYVEKELSSLFMNFSSTNKKTGLTVEVKDLKNVSKNILNRATITKVIKNNKQIYRITVFPKKDTFNKIYASIEPEEMLKVSYSSLLNKYLNKKLVAMSDFKENLSKITSSEPKDGFIDANENINKLLNKIFETKNEQYFIKKDYKDFFLYEEKLPNNEKLAQAVKIYKGLIKKLKGNLTYKASTAYMSNMMSGITASFYLGVNPKYIPKLVTQTFKEYKEWKKYEKKFAEMISKYGQEKARNWLKTVKKNNVFAEMIYDGKIGSLNNNADILYGSTHDDKALLHVLKKIDNKLGTNNAEKILTMIKTGMLDKETWIGSYLVNIYSNIDLFTRAIMYKYLKPNIGKDKAIKQINDILVDFRKEPIGAIKDIEYTAVPFLSFLLRMQGGITKTLYKHPLSVGSAILAYYMLSDNNDRSYIDGIRTDGWFLHRMIADPLVLQLSIPMQLYNGRLDSVIEHTLLPKEYITAYKVLQDKKEPISMLGITEEPKWIQNKTNN